MEKKELRWCAPDCPYCTFPDQEALSGACRTFTALYCTKFERLVQKSALCLEMRKDNKE